MDHCSMDIMKNFIKTHHQVCAYVIIFLIYTLFVCLRRKKYVNDSNMVYNTECPICFSTFITPIKSDCGHGFCLDCLYTYWQKSSWNNLCPLCRKAISNLKPAKHNGYDPLEVSEEVLDKLKKMSLKRHGCHFTRISDLSTSMSTFYPCFFCAIFLFLWTYAVSNFSKVINFVITSYNGLYDLKSEINV